MTYKPTGKPLKRQIKTIARFLHLDEYYARLLLSDTDDTTLAKVVASEEQRLRGHLLCVLWENQGLRRELKGVQQQFRDATLQQLRAQALQRLAKSVRRRSLQHERRSEKK